MIAADFHTARSVFTSEVPNHTVRQCGVSEFSVCDLGDCAKGLTHKLGDMADGAACVVDQTGSVSIAHRFWSVEHFTSLGLSPYPVKIVFHSYVTRE